jgi:hypothetical protein
MPPDANAPRPFPSTQWSLVERLRNGNEAVRRAAMEELLRKYLPPLKSHLVLEKRINPEQVDDLLQSFVSQQLLERDLVQKADPARGRFRTYLATTLDRFVVNALRDAAAQKRAPGQWEVLAEETAPVVDSRACDGFELQWAHQVLGEAMDRMKQECQATGRSHIWDIFDQRVVGPILRDAPIPAYSEMIEQFELVSPSHASNLLVTGKRTFARSLRAVIAEYAIDEGGIDSEIEDLWRILSRRRS